MSNAISTGAVNKPQAPIQTCNRDIYSEGLARNVHEQSSPQVENTENDGDGWSAGCTKKISKCVALPPFFGSFNEVFQQIMKK